MQYIEYLQFIFSLFIPMFIGFILYKLKLVDDNFSKGLSGYLFNFALPCSIIESMRLNIDFKEMLLSFNLTLICIIIILICYLFGSLTARLIEKDRKKRGLIVFSFMFSNFTFTAYPILSNLYGNEALFYASIFNIGMFVGSLTIGIYVIKNTGEDTKDSKFRLKDLINVPFLSLIFATILLFVKFELPYLVNSSISMLSATTAPLGIMQIGLIIAKKNSLNFKDIKAYIVSIARLIVIPVLTILTLRLFGLSEHMVYIPAIIICNPVAVNLVMLSETYDAPSETGANYVVISSMLSILTIPLIQLLL